MTNIILAFKIENLPSIPMTGTIKEKKINIQNEEQ